MGRDREVGMAIADVVSGKVTEPLGVRALVEERTVEPGDVFDSTEVDQALEAL